MNANNDLRVAGVIRLTDGATSMGTSTGRETRSPGGSRLNDGESQVAGQGRGAGGVSARGIGTARRRRRRRVADR